MSDLICTTCGRPVDRAGNWSDGPRYVHSGVNGSRAALCEHAVRPTLKEMTPGAERAHLLTVIDEARTVLNDGIHGAAVSPAAGLNALAVLSGPLVPHRPIGLDEHRPLDCEVCAEPWPCPSATKIGSGDGEPT